MKVRFYADNHNARFIWGWVDGQYVTDNSAEIENLVGLGLRHEPVQEQEIQKPRGKKGK